MPRPETGQLERAIRSLTIGTVKAMDSRKVQRRLEGLTEREEEYQIEVSGRGEEFPSWSEVHIQFENVYVDATGQRDSDLIRPHFYYGAYVPVGGPIGLMACVTRWDVNSRNETTGCMLSIGAVATDVARKFRGELHAVFHGYGAPQDVYGDLTGTEGG